ncbi:MAG: hypothetical protein AAF221_04125 [Pseudomonadota bacterium]
MPTDVPPPDSGEIPPWAEADPKAVQEQEKWADPKALQGQRNKNDLRWLKVYGLLVVILTAVFAMLFISSLVAWAWHYLTPCAWQWLSAAQLDRIQSFLFSGSIGGVVSLIAQRQLSK